MADKPAAMFGAFRNEASNRNHRYGEILENVDIASEVVENTDNNHLVQGLAEMFYEVYREDIRKNDRKKACFNKAKSLVGGRKKSRDLKQFRGKEGLRSAVAEAVEKGYIWRFQVETPWHPKIFAEDSHVTTFPYQHKFIVGYSAKPKHVFFHKSGKKYILDYFKTKFDDFFNSESILEQGFLKGANSHTGSVEGTKVRENRWGGTPANEAKDDAIWFTNLKGTRGYPRQPNGAGVESENGKVVYEGNVVFEIEVPSNFVVHHSGANTRWETVEEMKTSFGSPLQYKGEMIDNWSGTDKWDFKLAKKRFQSEGAVVLPLKYIVSVWDREEFPNMPYFVPFEAYVNHIREKYPERVPTQGEHVSQNSRVNIKELKKAREEFDQIRKFARRSSQFEGKMISVIKKIVETHEYLELGVLSRRQELSLESSAKMALDSYDKDWNNNLEHLKADYERITGSDFNWENDSVSLTDLLRKEDLDFQIENLIERVDQLDRSLMEGEKKFLEKVEAGENPDAHKKIQEMEQELGKTINQIPFITCSKQEKREIIDIIASKTSNSKKEIMEQLNETGTTKAAV